MRNFFLMFFFFISTSVYSIDDPFVSLQFSVGEGLIKPLVEGSNIDFSSVQWTTKSFQTITTIASGSNVLVPIVTSLDAALKQAAQNSTVGNTGSGTVLATGDFVSAMQAMSVAQSGVFIQAMFGLLDFSGKSLVLMTSKKENSLTIQNFFDMSMLSKLSWQQVVDFGNALRSFITVANITPLSQNDMTNRSNQFKYYSRYECSSYQLGGVAGTNGYCMPNTVFYKAHLMGCGLTGTSVQSVIPFSSGSYEREVQSLLGTQTTATYSTINCPTDDCLPNRVRYNSCDYDLYFNRVENPVLKCPQGLIFDPFDSNYYGGADIQVCKPNYSLDEVNSLYNLFINENGNFPYLELYPNNTFSVHPFISNNLSDSNSYPYNIRPSLSSGRDYFYYIKSIDQNVSVNFAFKSLLSENAFLISRTVNGLKLLRNGNIEVPIIIRDILKFSDDFKLMERSFSFSTLDGFDIAVGSTGLSPKTYGILGKTIAEQFGILTLSRDVVLPQQNTGNNQNNQNNQIVPCGLGKEVEVLRTRVNTQTGENENYYSKEASPACNIAWGQVPDAKTVSDFPTKDSKDLIPSYTKLSDAFKITLFPTSNQCHPLELDLSDAPLFKFGVIRFNKHCEYISQNPLIVELLRLVSMVSWFLLSLFILFSA